jgi:hypothetical protein
MSSKPWLLARAHCGDDDYLDLRSRVLMANSDWESLGVWGLGFGFFFLISNPGAELTKPRFIARR